MKQMKKVKSVGKITVEFKKYDEGLADTLRIKQNVLKMIYDGFESREIKSTTMNI